MKSIKEMTDDIIDIVHENSYKEIEEWDEETGHEYQINLSPKPELYEKLNTYFANMYVEIMIDVLKNYHNQKEPEKALRR